MNYKILQKISDQLNEKEPNLSYIRGMVETLLSMQPEVNDNKVPPKPISIIPSKPVNVEVIQGLGTGPNLLAIKDIAEKSITTQ